MVFSGTASAAPGWTAPAPVVAVPGASQALGYSRGFQTGGAETVGDVQVLSRTPPVSVLHIGVIPVGGTYQEQLTLPSTASLIPFNVFLAEAPNGAAVATWAAAPSGAPGAPVTYMASKTDKIDAALLARLLAAGFLAEVWTPDESTRVRRRLISRRMQLVRQRVREKNQVHAVLQRQLKQRPPMTDVFGVKGGIWLSDQCRLLPIDEQQTVDACLRQIDFLEREIELVDIEIAKQVLASEDIGRLMTLPGVSGVTATAMLAAIGDVSRFPTAEHLVGYLGLSPRVQQSGSEPAKHDRISKQGPGPVRGLLVEAAWHAARTTGPLRAFHQRVAARRGANIATVAVARKLAVIAFHLLRRGEEYAFGRPSLHREKLRRYELMLGAPRQQGKRLASAGRTFATVDQRRLEKELAGQAETAYRRLVADWTATKGGTGATPGRALERPSKGIAARQAASP